MGRVLTFPAAASWATAPLPPGLAEGVLTSVAAERGTLVSAGDVLYTVDLRPITVLEGAVPAFRDLHLGIQGPDVRQLRAFLQTAGHLRSGSDSDRFDAAVAAAVKRWQHVLGVPTDGVVRAADVLFAPTLPLRVWRGDDIEVGGPVSAERPVIVARSIVPDFTVTLAAEQVATAPTEGPVTVSGQGADWSGVVASAAQVEDNLILTLAAPEGGPLCGNDCARLTPRFDGSAVGLKAEFVVVPETTGPIVPVAALALDGAGSAFVTLEDGTRVDVAVVAQSGGLAVVDGISNGQVILLFGDGAGGAASAGPG